MSGATAGKISGVAASCVIFASSTTGSVGSDFLGFGQVFFGRITGDISCKGSVINSSGGSGMDSGGIASGGVIAARSSICAKRRLSVGKEDDDSFESICV